MTAGSRGATALHVLVWRNDTFGAVQLIDAGADVTIKSEFGASPSDLAREVGGDMPRLLMDH